MRDPHLAMMVKTALENGLIDRAAALLAWRLIAMGIAGNRPSARLRVSGW